MLFLIIPLVAFLVLVYLILHYRQKALQDRNRVIEESIRCNRQLPPEFFGGSRADDPTNAQSPTDMAMLRNGIIWISIGLAVFFFFVNAREEELAVLGIIPIGIGIGKMLPWILKRNQNSSRQPYHNNYPPQYPPSSNDPSLSNNPNNNYNNSNNSNNYNNSNNSNNYNNPNNYKKYNNPNKS
ncbi:MAG: DUF6249 domain-containing protein, partial [Bacteroidales bacterium]|nr:DUF6249 domain-containing protein [Bacteroidales bacterium]